MKKLLLTTAMFASAICMQAQTTVSLDKAGTLSDKISSSEKYDITSLKISGPINGTDIILLRDMAGMDMDNKASDGKLESLDLSEAQIVAGGEPYYVSYSGAADKEYYSRDNEMGNAMFFSCSKLQSVKLPNTVTVIGDSCFYKCSNLSEVAIPASVKSIRSYALSYTAIPEFSFPEGMEITANVLSGCSSLKSLTIPSDITEIPSSAFSGTGITSIELPKALKTIGEEAFSGSMLTSVTCPDGLQTIGESAFARCKKLTEVKFNDKLDSIGQDAFYSCGSLKEAIVPNSVKKMGGAFGVCGKLTKAHLPEGLTYISKSMFDRCSMLEEVNIPEGVTSIGNLAFQNDGSLQEITFPDVLTSIGKSAFSGCSGLTEIKLPNSVTTIGESCFSGCDGATVIELSTSLKEISKNALSYCSELKELVIPEGVETIKDFAIMACDNMTKITLPSTLKTVGSASVAANELLAEIHCAAVTPPTITARSFMANDDECKLYVPKGSKEAYENAEYWKDFYKIEEETTTGINNAVTNGSVSEVARYNSIGQRTNSSCKGVQIVRYSDGKTVKVAR